MLGLAMFQFLLLADFAAIPYKRQPNAPKAREVPPYNGFGSEEDSLCSCAGLLPKPPRRDFVKFMEKDRQVDPMLKLII